jgi:hypothetical protein
VGKSRNQAFKNIKERVCRWLNDWKLKFLSQAGNEILFKAVIQAISTYSMSIFLLPKELCAEIDSLMQNFWWGHQGNESRIHWISWSRMGLSKDHGGMGFRDLVSFNKALLAKQGWRLLKNPKSLAARIIKVKYYSNDQFLKSKLGSKPSFAWRSIHGARDTLEAGLFWRIGNGKEACIWGDNWIPRPSTYRIQSSLKVLDSKSTVHKLYDWETAWWNVALLYNLFTVEERDAIMTVPNSQTDQPDFQVLTKILKIMP